MAKRYRSLFEANFARDLHERNIDADYERDVITYIPKPKSYTPDFYIKEGDFYVETKGRFFSCDRAKHLQIKKQHPEIDIRFVFLKAKNRLDKRSKTTYAQWCEKNGFLFAEERMPGEWMMKKKKL